MRRAVAHDGRVLTGRDVTRDSASRSVMTVVWCGVTLLSLIGVTAALLRVAYPSDLAGRAEPLRQTMMSALGRTDPFFARRAQEVALFDARFASFRLATLLHVIPGGLFLLLAPLQFSSRLRDRHRGVHRWTGRLLVMAALLSVGPALHFGVMMPYAGVGESIAVATFGGLFVIAIITAFVAIRMGDVSRHREWMIRAFAVAIGISVVRLVSIAVDIALSPAGVSPQTVFVVSIWMGWLLTLGAGEMWIVGTRRQVTARLSPTASS